VDAGDGSVGGVGALAAYARVIRAKVSSVASAPVVRNTGSSFMADLSTDLLRVRATPAAGVAELTAKASNGKVVITVSPTTPVSSPINWIVSENTVPASFSTVLGSRLYVTLTVTVVAFNPVTVSTGFEMVAIIFSPVFENRCCK